MSRLFCFGLGYGAAVLAEELKVRGWRIAGTARDDESCAALAARGYDMQPFSRARPFDDPAATLAGATHILLSIPPDDQGDPVMGLCGNALALPDVQWLGYLSTSAVYGDRDGAWVDEDTAPAPTSERGRRRLAAESAWRALSDRIGLPLHVFRLAGIYGPGRSALDLVRSGAAVRILRPGHLFSRIHVKDLASVLGASIAHPRPRALYNVCDDEPAPQADVVAYAAALLGRAAPPEMPLDAAPLSAMARSFYAENKRVRNARIKAELGVRLRFPTYRQGLAAILAEEAPLRAAPH
jgi:nucleoside-diphosphate-sugar epimerase